MASYTNLKLGTNLDSKDLEIYQSDNTQSNYRGNAKMFGSLSLTFGGAWEHFSP